MPVRTPRQIIAASLQIAPFELHEVVAEFLADRILVCLRKENHVIIHTPDFSQFQRELKRKEPTP